MVILVIVRTPTCDANHSLGNLRNWDHHFQNTVMTTNRFLVRFVQQHPAFRCPELESSALLSECAVKLPLKFVEYDDASPFAVLELDTEVDAAALIKRSILTQ